ncbi:MAG: phenylalanine--tRNA ligase subunit beta, partial [Ginsengibacter sp.]
RISYNWLKEFIEGLPAPNDLGKILTAIGLEVESLEKIEQVKGNLEGLLVGEVLECRKHPEADKLQITEVDIQIGENLQIVCGASNVAKGQRVVVAPVGVLLHTFSGENIKISKAKIRGVESRGMICAEDEIGISNDHNGIIVLPAATPVGSKVADYYKPAQDHVFEIGITPNRVDGMSHQGVARDLMAYFTYHNLLVKYIKQPAKIKSVQTTGSLIKVIVENEKDCRRYSGVIISGIKVEPSPAWLKFRLKAVGVRPVNNIVDITNYVLYQTGQPLHAFDQNDIKGGQIKVKNLPEGTPFITLDEKERKLSSGDLMICDGENTPMCIGGVFGGLGSGVKDSTENIFLESAWFNPTTIRRSSLKHDLRTDAAIRFEKNVDISKTVHALFEATNMIISIAGGKIEGDITDVYPQESEKKIVNLKYDYLKKLSGKIYTAENVSSVFTSLEFDILKHDAESITVAVPLHKPDISLPADLVEEVMRIDGLDNIVIPKSITLSPAVEKDVHDSFLQAKVAGYLTGSGFAEIFTNSLTNSKYYSEEQLQSSVQIINSISVDLNIMRLGLMETGLESVAYNLNRKNNDLKLYEFGKSYAVADSGAFEENNLLGIFLTGNHTKQSWKGKADKTDSFVLKGICENIFALCGLKESCWQPSQQIKLENGLMAISKDIKIAEIGQVSSATSNMFGIKQAVYFASIYWDKIIELSGETPLAFKEIPKFPEVERDLSIVIDKQIQYAQVEDVISACRIKKLATTRLFDVFTSDKLGDNRKALALSFTFIDNEKTLIDKEIEGMMAKLMAAFESQLGAEIRK